MLKGLHHCPVVKLSSYDQSIKNNAVAANVAVGPVAHLEDAEFGFELGVEEGPAPAVKPAVCDCRVEAEALGGEPLFALMISTAFTGLVLLSAF